MRKVWAYLRSERLKHRLYQTTLFGLLGTVIFLVATFDKQLIKPKRAETGGYDGYDDD